MIVLTNVNVSYRCPKCNDPVSVYWTLARIPLNRLELATKKECDKFDCKKIPLRIVRISAKAERTQP